MKFGLTYAVGGVDGRDMAKNYATTLEQIQLAEELGYEHAFISEHHFLTRYAILPSPLIAIAYAAAKTEKIKLGTGILLMPLHNPVKVAEDAAIVDVVSGGRLILGLGQGYRPEEFAGYHRKLEDRGVLMREGAELVRRFWTEESVSFEGEYYNYDNVTLTPKPLQSPPPIWIGAKVPRAVRLAGEVGDVWYADPITPLDLIVKRKEQYYKGIENSGRAKESGQVAYYRETFVGETSDQAWADGGKGITGEYMGYLSFGHLVDNEGNPVATDRTDLVEPIVRQRATVGDAAEVLDDLKSITEVLQPDHFVFKMKHGGVSDEATRQSMKLCAEKVMPHL
jgi:alkanesulfonate monooxygenase SsuD/methylene tetrahydromethanopterin reductase-like flavin-dependent oxidoreductase (luciferase family)